jgi:hypothetical protein
MLSLIENQNILATFPEFYVRDWADTLIFLARTHPASFPTTGTGDLAARAADLAVSLLTLGASQYLNKLNPNANPDPNANPNASPNPSQSVQYNLLKNPIIRASLVGILAEFSHIGKQYKSSQLVGGIIPGNLLGKYFSQAVVENIYVQKDAAVGLLGIYVDADIVEGLDVDKVKKKKKKKKYF